MSACKIASIIVPNLPFNSGAARMILQFNTLPLAANQPRFTQNLEVL